MKPAYALTLLLIAAASAGAQATKTPAKPDSSKAATAKAPANAKAPVTQGTKQALPPAANTKQADTKTAAPGATKAADTKAAPQGATKAADTKQAAPAPAPAPPAALKTPVIMREVYNYAVEGRRDPFVSLLTSSDLRPTVADLKLTSILYDENGSSSTAVMRDVTDNKQYRVQTGQTIGRMKVALIKRRVVIFSIEEFGLNRQDSLVLGDTTKARAK